MTRRTNRHHGPFEATTLRFPRRLLDAARDVAEARNASMTGVIVACMSVALRHPTELAPEIERVVGDAPG